MIGKHKKQSQLQDSQPRKRNIQIKRINNIDRIQQNLDKIQDIPNRLAKWCVRLHKRLINDHDDPVFDLRTTIMTILYFI